MESAKGIYQELTEFVREDTPVAVATGTSVLWAVAVAKQT
jgi:hypothetical protein